MTEFKTMKDYNDFLKGNEFYMSEKVLAGKFNLYRCNYCQSHFDNISERDEHHKTHCDHTEDGMVHCKDCDTNDEWYHHPSANLSDSDFKDGGTIFK